MTAETLKILICDNSILARKQLKGYLYSIGCTNVIDAADGISAIQIYKRQKPDLVFLDIVMTSKNGLEVTKEILTYDPCAYIVIASSVGTQKNIREALEYGAKDFIQKPLNTKQVHRVVTTVMKGGF